MNSTSVPGATSAAIARLLLLLLLPLLASVGLLLLLLLLLVSVLSLCEDLADVEKDLVAEVGRAVLVFCFGKRVWRGGGGGRG